VELVVTVVDDGDETRSLHTWLADEPTVRRYGKLGWRTSGPPADGMGTLEVVSVIVGSGLSVAQLLNFIVSWRASRPQPVLVRVQAGSRTVEVRTAGTEDIRRLVDELEAGIGGPAEGS
jgi:hypothetical protein